MTWRRPSQSLKSPTTDTRRALGAQTAKCTPFVPFMLIGWAPRRSNRRRCEPSAKQVVVHRAEHGPVNVGVVDRPRSLAVELSCRIAQWLPRCDGRPPSKRPLDRAGARACRQVSIEGHRLNFAGPRDEGAGEKAANGFLNAKNRKRVRMRSGSDCFCFFRRQGKPVLSASGTVPFSVMGRLSKFPLHTGGWCGLKKTIPCAMY
jgi:hypothetical protein